MEGGDAPWWCRRRRSQLGGSPRCSRSACRRGDAVEGHCSASGRGGRRLPLQGPSRRGRGRRRGAREGEGVPVEDEVALARGRAVGDHARERVVARAHVDRARAVRGDLPPPPPHRPAPQPQPGRARARRAVPCKVSASAAGRGATFSPRFTIVSSKPASLPNCCSVSPMRPCSTPTRPVIFTGRWECRASASCAVLRSAREPSPGERNGGWLRAGQTLPIQASATAATGHREGSGVL